MTGHIGQSHDTEVNTMDHKQMASDVNRSLADIDSLLAETGEFRVAVSQSNCRDAVDRLFFAHDDDRPTERELERYIRDNSLPMRLVQFPSDAEEFGELQAARHEIDKLNVRFTAFKWHIHAENLHNGELLLEGLHEQGLHPFWKHWGSTTHDADQIFYVLMYYYMTLCSLMGGDARWIEDVPGHAWDNIDIDGEYMAFTNNVLNK
jgi:hypothetical protein